MKYFAIFYGLTFAKIWLTGSRIAGIERILRMVQAILMVVISQPFLTSGFSKLVTAGNQYVWTEPRTASIDALVGLRGQVAIVRRFLRMFRFLESFHAAHKIYTSFYAPASPPRPPAAADTTTGEKTKPPNPKRNAKVPAEAWLDIFGRTFNGMYLLLEALTLLDALGLPDLSLWGREGFATLHVEGQRFWFFALVCGVLSGLAKLVKLVAYAPVPQTGEGYGVEAVDKELPEWQKLRERMRRAVQARKDSRVAWRREIATRGYALGRRVVADLGDLVVPGSVVGWVDVGQGTVGWVMIVTTWLTGAEIWERCGKEIG